MDTMKQQKLTPKIVLSLVSVIVLVVLYWVFSHAYIEISVSSNTDGEISYLVTNQSSGDIISHKNTNKTIKKLVKKGAYEVYVKNGLDSYFKTVKTGSFLSTTSVKAALKTENEREFTGENPLSCMRYIDAILLSFPCKSSLNNIQYHLPATASRPTYVDKNESVITGVVEDFVRLGGEDYVLVRAPKNNEDQGSPHTLYVINEDLEPVNGKAVLGLNDNDFYDLSEYKDGFLAVSTDSESALLYESVNKDPLTIPLESLESGTKLQFARISNDRIVRVYSNALSEEGAGFHEESENVTSYIAVTSVEGETSNYRLGAIVTDVLVCGEDLLCVLGNDKLKIYKVSGSELTQINEIIEVRKIKHVGRQLLVFRNDYVISYDIESGDGFVSYTFGEYKYCGVGAIQDNSYTLCLLSPANKKLALKVSLDKNTRDPIDKKILPLVFVDEIKSFSIYGNFIHISPNLGELVYDQSSGIFDYHPAVKSHVNQIIRQTVQEAGIDTERYTIVNPFD